MGPADTAPPLHARGVGELLDAAIKLYRNHWRLYIGITAIVLGPFLLLQAVGVRAAVGGAADELTSMFGGTPFGPGFEQPPAGLPALLGRLFGVAAVFGLVNLLIVIPFLTAATARATAEIYLGRVPTVRDVYRFALAKLGSVLWVTILTGLIALGLIVAFGLVMALVGVLLPTPMDVVLVVLLGLTGFVAFVYVFIRLVFGTTTVVVEDRRGAEAIGRSWQLSDGYFWKILGMTLLAAILAWIVGFILRFPFGLMGMALGDAGWIMNGVGEALAQVIVNPFSLIIVVLLYFDMRIRKEAFDLTLMAQDLQRSG